MKPDENQEPILTLSEFKSKFRRYRLDYAFFRKKCENTASGLSNNPKMLISLYEGMIQTINEQIKVQESQLKEAEYYGEDGEGVKEEISNELNRQKDERLKEVESKLAKARDLDVLFSLAPDALYKEAQNNKKSALLIVETPALFTQISDSQVIEIVQTNPEVKQLLLKPLFALLSQQLFEKATNNKVIALLIAQTPTLIAKISDSQIPSMAHHDSEISKLLASTLASRDYSTEIAEAYATLIQQVTSETDRHFIIGKENEGIQNLLVKINAYLDRKIEESLQQKASPWSLGYFGSRYKVIKDKQKVSIPQGIYQLKQQIEQQGTRTPKEILSEVQLTLNKKLKESSDESFLKQLKRLVSYLFGYHRTNYTIQEYKGIDQMISRKPTP